MGHANVSNLSEFFIRRLYAKGTLSIAQCVEALLAKGEKLHASEGDYEEDYMLGMGLLDVIHYLTRTDPSQHGYSGPQGGGPWIEPVLTAWWGGKQSVTPLTRRMLDEIEQGSNDELTVHSAADRLEEEGFPEWAARLRALPNQRRVYREWIDDKDGDWEWTDDGTGSGNVFDSIPWRFTPGWRNRYREVPRLHNVTH
jgi:hypothetical protein